MSGCDYIENPKWIGIVRSIKLFNENDNII